MISNNRNQLLSGIGTAFLVWALLVVADLIDETVLDNGFFIGAIMYILVPIILLVCYIFNYMVYKPKLKKVLTWFKCYCLTFVFLWLIILVLTNNDLLVIQKYRGSNIYLNGFEYVFYGIPAVLGFGTISLIFHLIFLAIVKKK